MKKLYIGFLVLCLLFVTACNHKKNIENDSLSETTAYTSADETSEYNAETTIYSSSTITTAAETLNTTLSNSGSSAVKNSAAATTKSGAPASKPILIDTTPKKVDTPISQGISLPPSITANQNSNSKTTASPQSTAETTTPKKEATSYIFTLDAQIKNWVNDGNVVYAITSAPNRLWVFNAATMKTIGSVALPGSPAEIQLENSQILISYPTLQSIKYYDKNKFTETKSIDLPHIVSSFVISNGFVYYSEDDQWCRIYKTDLSNKTPTVMTEGFFYFPKLLINEQDNLLYVIESGSTGSKVHYFHTSNLILQSETSGYGYSNITRYAYFDGQYLYAMNFKIDKTNADHIVGEFTSNKSYWDGIINVSNNYIITKSALFSKETLEPILIFKEQFNQGMITSNNTLLLCGGNELYVIPAN